MKFTFNILSESYLSFKSTNHLRLIFDNDSNQWTVFQCVNRARFYKTYVDLTVFCTSTTPSTLSYGFINTAICSLPISGHFVNTAELTNQIFIFNSDFHVSSMYLLYLCNTEIKCIFLSKICPQRLGRNYLLQFSSNIELYILYHGIFPKLSLIQSMTV